MSPGLLPSTALRIDGPRGEPLCHDTYPFKLTLPELRLWIRHAEPSMHVMRDTSECTGVEKCRAERQG